MQGTIFDIKHYAIHDGPGIRTTVFFKGCPLGCWWCHNPESRDKEIRTFTKKERIGKKELVTRDQVGKVYSTDEVMKEIEKDSLLFEESGGGVTFSGGEPFYQFDFLMELLKLCNNREIHTCIDTTGHVETARLEKTAYLANLYLFDIKQIDDDKHRKYTGVSNKLILENLLLLDQFEKDIEIRYPLIPGMNDDKADLLRLMGFLQKLKKNYPVSILPYHKIGRHKYERFNVEYKMHGIEEPSDEHIEKIKNSFEEAGFTVNIGG